MEQYVALDVSLQKIAVCVLNASGRVVIEAEVASEPGVLISFIRNKSASCGQDRAGKAGRHHRGCGIL